MSSNSKGRFKCETPECACDKSLRHSIKIKRRKITLNSSAQAFAMGMSIALEGVYLIGMPSTLYSDFNLVNNKSHKVVCVDYYCKGCGASFWITYDATSDKGARRQVGRHLSDKVATIRKTIAGRSGAFIDANFSSMPSAVGWKSKECNEWAKQFYKLIK
jgi:hypothetical protein